MGSKGGSQTTQSQSSSSPPPQVMADYQGLVNRATNTANTPYTQYPGELVAPLSTQTQQGLGAINQYAGAAQPFYNAAAGATMAAATPVSPTQFSAGQVNQYMNPYTQDVVNATQNQFNNQNQQSAQFLNSQNISSGAFGGDRAGISQAILANQQQTAQAPVLAGLYNQNYNQALSEFNTQQGVGLQAQAFNNQQLGQMGNQLAGIGTQAQQAGLQGAQAQLQAGMIPQQEQQQIDTSLYNQYLQQQAYPFQTTGWLGNIVEGTGSLSGGTSQGSTTTPVGSPLSQGLGMAQSGLGILGNLMTMSDVHAKENIHPVGKTFDGQTIYRFNYKGDPRTQVGLIAQETEHHHPEAVGHSDGMRTVDYDAATRDAANRGHFANGGAPPPMTTPMGGGMINYPTTQQAPSSGRFPQVGQQAYTLGALGDPGARAGMGGLGLITGRAPMMNMQGMGGAQGGTTGAAPINLRQGFDSGGNVPVLNTNSYDPITGLLNPQAGIANAQYDFVTAGSKNPGYSIDTGVAQAIGTPPAPTGTQYTTVPGTPQNVPAMDWQNPGNNFQTAGAEASLAGLIGRPGIETSPSESSPPASALPSAAGATGGGATTGGGNPLGLSQGVINQLNAWGSGSPTAFGGTGNPNISGSPAGTMPGVSVGDRMESMTGTGGGGGAVPGVGGGGQGVTTANPPRAAVSPVVQAVAAPAMTPQRQIILMQGQPQEVPQQSVHGGPGAGASGGGAGGGFARGGPARVYRAAGGMLGQAGMGAALAQPPAQAMVTPTPSSGGSAPGFNNMFGGSGGMRPTFADGGSPSMNPAIGSDPFSQVTTWVPSTAPTIMGKGPPSEGAPHPPSPASGGGQPSPGDSLKGLGDAATKLAGQVKGKLNTGQPTDSTTGPDITADDASDILGGADLSGVFNALDDTTFDGSSAPVGGGIGMMARGGRARGHFASGGADDADIPTAIDNNFGGPDVAPAPVIKTVDAPVAAAPAPKLPEGSHLSSGDQGDVVVGGDGKVIGPAPKGAAFPAATAPTPAPVAPVPSSVKTAPIVKAAAPAPTGPSPVVASPASINAAIDSVYGGGSGDQASPAASPVSATGGFNLDAYKARVRQIEDPSGDPNAISPAGAHGIYQFMPQTAARYGGEGEEAMNALTADNMAALRAGLGRDPTPAELYLAHQQGAKGALDLLSHPDQSAASLVGRAAVTGNGGTADMTAGQFANLWLNKFDRTSVASAPSSGASEVSSTGAVDPNALVAPVVGGNKYFTAKDYADPNSSKREFFNALMYGGFAMMGGESRNPWVNIGRGEMAGMDYYAKQQGLDRDWIEKQAQIDHLSADDRRADADVNLRNQQMQIEAMKIKYAMDGAKERTSIDSRYDTPPASTAPAPAPTPSSGPPPAAAAIGAPGEGTSPVVIAGQPTTTPAGPGAYPALGPRGASPPPAAAPAQSAAAAPNPAAPSAAAQPVAALGPDGKPTVDWWNQNVAKEDNPHYWSDLAAADERRGVFDPQAAQRAIEERRIAVEVGNRDTVRGRDGSIIDVPGALDAKQRTAAATAAGTAAGEAANKPIDFYVKGDDGKWTQQRGTPAEMAAHPGAQINPPTELQQQEEQAKATGKGVGENAPEVIAGRAASAAAVKAAETTAETIAKPTTVYDDEGNPITVTGQKAMDIAKANSSGSQPMLNGKPVYSGETPMAKGMVAGFQEFQKDQSRFLRDYQSNKDMLVSLGRAFTRYQAGGGEASRAIADLDGIAKKLDIENVLPANWRGDAAGFALATKIATQAAFKVIQDSGANRAPRTGLQEALVTSARAEADPAANWKIITNGLATLEYAHDLYNNPDSFKSINVNKNIAAFDASHPLDRYLDKAQKETPMFKGVTPKTYQMVTGKASLVQDPKTKDIYDPDVPSAHWNEKGEVVP